MNLLDKFSKKKEVTTATPNATPTNVDQAKPIVEGLVSTKDIIAPAALEVDTDYIKIGERYYRTVFTVINRRFVEVNWLSSLINFDATQTVSFYIYPSDGKEILDDLRRKIAEMEAEITTDIQRGKVVNPSTQAKLEDALNLQADLVKGEERFFQMGLYITLNATTKEDLDKITKNLEAAMGSLMVLTKKTSYCAEDGFITTLPLCQDKLNITRNMDTTSLATTFPFVSSDLSDDKGVMFGINEHNGSLVIFDRFSMPNYNSVVFATAGAGKSYMIKLEVLRSLMLGTDVIVIDPENEYKSLSDAVGGQYVAFGYDEPAKINPFDLALEGDDGENALNSKILNLHKLFKVMIGAMDPIEESILDKAVVEAYKAKGITPDIETQKKEPPLIEDLYKALIGMEDQKAAGLAARIEKYIKGSFAGIFNQKTNVNLNNGLVVFGIRNLEDALRPVAMQIILDYIWTVVKKDLRKRILVVDEAWYLMQYEDSASFLRGIVKRGRKYYLGVTTITQDVDDFLQTPYGKEIVTNSSIQILLKQHSAAIDQVGQVFYLSEGEKQLLLAADKGEGIFFAGQNHVAIKVVASEDEHRLITSNPEEVLKMKTAPKPEEIKPAAKPIEIKPWQTNTPSAPPVLPNPTIPVTTPKTETSEPAKVEPIEQPQKAPFEAVVEVKSAPSQNNQPAATNPADDLKKKIAEMEAQEQKKIEDHRLKLEEETKQKEETEKKDKLLFSGGLGKLPSYQELFKSQKLPNLPKPNLPTTEIQGPTQGEPKKNPFTTEVVENKILAPKKPTFVNMAEETKVPQPPQLQKAQNKIKVEMVDETTVQKPQENTTVIPIDKKTLSPDQKPNIIVQEKKPETPPITNPTSNEPTVKTEEKKEEPINSGKPTKKDGPLTYDDLFGDGNGIV